MERRIYTPIPTHEITPQMQPISSNNLAVRRPPVPGNTVFRKVLSPRQHVPKIESYDSNKEEDVPPRNNEAVIYKEPSSDFEVVRTPYGTYTIPNYTNKSFSDIQIDRASYARIIAELNRRGKDKLKEEIPAPTRNENIRELAIRTLQAQSFLENSSGAGSDIWFVLLCVGWSFIENTMQQMGYPCKGFATNQIKTYKTVYEKYINDFSISVGFGKDWPAWMQITAVTAATLLLNVVLRNFPALRKKSGTIIELFTQQLTGVTPKKNSVLEYDSKGRIADINRTTDKRSEGGNPLGDIMGMFSGMLSGGGGGGGIQELLGTVQTMISPPQKKTESERKKDRKNREKEEDFGI